MGVDSVGFILVVEPM